MTDPVSVPSDGPGLTREQVAQRINRAMTRFPLILEILDELSQPAVPLPGDAELRHGCERGLTAMLAALASLSPARFPLTGRQGPQEEIALSLLLGRMPYALIDPGRLERFDQFIHRLLPGS